MDLEKIIKSGTRILGTSFLVGALTTVPFLVGCDKDEKDTSSKTEQTQAPGISEKFQAMWPIWTHTDLEINKYQGPAVTYATEIKIRPKFYNGRMPLKYHFTQTFIIGNVLKHKFKDFTNYFIYEKLMLVGAVSVHNDNKMVAEARINYSKEGMMLEPNMEEFHYAKGLLVYHCMSQVDRNTGMKTEESQRSGKKQKDYFFILPFGVSSGMPRSF